jgi:hypothetical protein
MNKKIVIPVLIVLIIALLGYIYFGLIQRTDQFGEFSIPCNDTAEFTYGANTNLLIKVKQKCGDSLRVETKSGSGEWTPLITRQNSTLGPRDEVVNFDANTVALVGLRGGDKIRFICFDGEFDSCKVEVKNIANERAFLRAKTDSVSCGGRVSAKVYNFTRSSSMVLRVNWSSICGTMRGGRFIPSKPKLYVKDNNQTRDVLEVAAALIQRRGRRANLDNYTFPGSPRGGKELLIECPGNSGSCEYSISIKGR